MYFVKGRVYAKTCGEVAMMVRDKYNEYKGKLVITERCPELEWIEYHLAILEEGDS